LYNFLDISSDGVKMGDRFNKTFGSEAEAKFKEVRMRASQKAQQIIERSDGVINESDKVGAQRNVLTNMFMMHKGWLPILLTRRFKQRQFNIQLNKMEEGHYRALMRVLVGSAKSIKNMNFNAVREVLSEMESDQIDNIKRAGWEIGIFSAVFLLGAAIMAADDDDDSYIEDFARLIYLRTASEYSTTQLFSIPGVGVDTAKNPIVAIRTLDALEPVSLLKDVFSDIITMGDGEGLSTYKRIKKNSVVKRADQLGDLQKQIDAYRHFNKGTLYWLAEKNK